MSSRHDRKPVAVANKDGESVSMSSGTTRSLTASIHVGAAGATGCKQPAHVVGGIPRGYAWFGVTSTTCMYCDSQGVSSQWRIYFFLLSLVCSM